VQSKAQKSKAQKSKVQKDNARDRLKSSLRNISASVVCSAYEEPEREIHFASELAREQHLRNKFYIPGAMLTSHNGLCVHVTICRGLLTGTKQCRLNTKGGVENAEIGRGSEGEDKKCGSFADKGVCLREERNKRARQCGKRFYERGRRANIGLALCHRQSDTRHCTWRFCLDGLAFDGFVERVVVTGIVFKALGEIVVVGNSTGKERKDNDKE